MDIGPIYLQYQIYYDWSQAPSKLCVPSMLWILSGENTVIERTLAVTSPQLAKKGSSPSSAHILCTVASLESTVSLGEVTGCMAGFSIACWKRRWVKKRTNTQCNWNENWDKCREEDLVSLVYPPRSSLCLSMLLTEKLQSTGGLGKRPGLHVVCIKVIKRDTFLFSPSSFQQVSCFSAAKNSLCVSRCLRSSTS